MSRPVTTVEDSSTPCWPIACHMAGAVSPAQATKTRSAPASFACEANGVKSVAVAGTSSGGHGGPTLRAEDGGDGGDVGLSEGAVLGDDQHLLARGVPDERLGGEDVPVG